jgi:hypothetical protein
MAILIILNFLKSFNFSAEKNGSKLVTSLRTVWTCLIEYIDLTTIHGVKYVGERQRSLFERLLVDLDILWKSTEF